MSWSINVTLWLPFFMIGKLFPKSTVSLLAFLLRIKGASWRPSFWALRSRSPGVNGVDWGSAKPIVPVINQESIAIGQICTTHIYLFLKFQSLLAVTVLAIKSDKHFWASVQMDESFWSSRPWTGCSPLESSNILSWAFSICDVLGFVAAVIT